MKRTFFLFLLFGFLFLLVVTPTAQASATACEVCNTYYDPLLNPWVQCDPVAEGGYAHCLAFPNYCEYNDWCPAGCPPDCPMVASFLISVFSIEQPPQEGAFPAVISSSSLMETKSEIASRGGMPLSAVHLKTAGAMVSSLAEFFADSEDGIALGGGGIMVGGEWAGPPESGAVNLMLCSFTQTSFERQAPVIVADGLTLLSVVDLGTTQAVLAIQHSAFSAEEWAAVGTERQLSFKDEADALLETPLMQVGGITASQDCRP